MSLADGCDTGLALGLSCATAGKPAPPAIRRDQPPGEPSLTLSLSDEVYGPNTPPARPSSPGWSTVTSFSAVKRERPEKDAGGGGSDDDDEGSAARKKLRLTKEQSALLEERFKEHSTLNPKQKQALAKQLNLRPRQVEVWFQNRRARTKLKQTEVDCEFLKRCCETLTEENRRLHKELQELRAIKLAPPPLYMQIPAAAAATLAMCPSCERASAAAAAGAAGGDHAPSSGGGHFVVAPKARFYSPFAHPAVV